jgi:mycothiol synthase
MSIRQYQPGDEAGVSTLLLGALDAGDLPGYPRVDIEGVIVRLPGESDGTLLFIADGDVLGFYQPHYPLMVVRHDARRRGIGTELVEAGRTWARERGEAEVWLAPPRGSAGALAFCERLGFRYRTSYWGMQLDPAVPVPAPAFPEFVDSRPFSIDIEQDYVNLINASFADHVTPLVVTVEMVRHSHSLPGRGPESVLILTPRDQPEQLIGFCRTLTPITADDIYPSIGTLGLLPAWRGRGLGRELLRWGIQRLRVVAPGPILIGVDGENERALALYERTGFRRTEEWPRWAKGG